MLRMVSFGTSSRSTASCQASSFASAVGLAARAAAALSWPEIVLSRSSSAVIAASPARPAVASAISRLQRRSTSTASPSRVRVPSSRPATRSSDSSDLAAPASARTKVSCLSLPGSAASASVRMPASHVAMRRSRFVRRRVRRHDPPGLTRSVPAARSCLSRLAIPRSTSVDPVGRSHLGIAGHVPGGSPAQRPRQRLGELVDVVDHASARTARRAVPSCS